MRNILFLLFMLGITVTTFTNQAQGGSLKLYIRGDVGGFIPINKFKEKSTTDYLANTPKKGAVYNIGVGYIVNDHWRSDLNFNYRYLKYKADKTDAFGDVSGVTQKTKIYSLFFNGYYDLNFHKIIKPYLTAGVGYNRTNSSSLFSTENGVIDDEFTGKKVNNFIWNVGVGTRFILNNRFSLDASYRYVNLGKTTTKNSKITTAEGASQKIKSHDIMGGVIVYL